MEMNPSLRVPLRLLGQSGCRLSLGGTIFYVDPYLSDSVRTLDAPDLHRLQPIPVEPENIDDADWVLITHEHIDHCDPHTLPKLAKASPKARFIGPRPVLRRLLEWGIVADRMALAQEEWSALGGTVRVHAIPAAHPEIERDADGSLSCVGYLLEYAGRRLYLAGDTRAHQEIIDALVKHGPVHTAFLPVNEPNFFKGRRGIIGNMSVREAFQFATEIGAKQVVTVHWDMFAANAVDPDEIRTVYRHLKPAFSLLLKPEAINLSNAGVSVVIRTLNEAQHLPALLQAVAEQDTAGLEVEVVLVDSGSTDGTLAIAERFGCRILHIRREEFSFGRSLNMGCAAAQGDILVFTSGHCVPTDSAWLRRLCQPILEGQAEYAYGRQFGGNGSHFSETRIFAKYFPEQSAVPQEGFFCNNANAALLRACWDKYRFNEELTGLEDMELAKRLAADGCNIAYVAEAGVFHYHQETWPQVRRRFEREAIALQQIMPQVHVNFLDAIRYICSSVWRDWRAAGHAGSRTGKLPQILRYRWNQYMGVFKGNHEHRRLSHAQKERYFFPD